MPSPFPTLAPTPLCPLPAPPPAHPPPPTIPLAPHPLTPLPPPPPTPTICARGWLDRDRQAGVNNACHAWHSRPSFWFGRRWACAGTRALDFSLSRLLLHLSWTLQDISFLVAAGRRDRQVRQAGSSRPWWDLAHLQHTPRLPATSPFSPFSLQALAAASVALPCGVCISGFLACCTSSILLYTFPKDLLSSSLFLLPLCLSPPSCPSYIPVHAWAWHVFCILLRRISDRDSSCALPSMKADRRESMVSIHGMALFAQSIAGWDLSIACMKWNKKMKEGDMQRLFCSLSRE